MAARGRLPVVLLGLRWVAIIRLLWVVVHGRRCRRRGPAQLLPAPVGIAEGAAALHDAGDVDDYRTRGHDHGGD
jgi:hypothetical protein